MRLKRITTKEGEVYFVDTKTGIRVSDDSNNYSLLAIPKDKKAFSSELLKSGISLTIEIFGVIYFLLSCLGAVLLWIGSSKKIETSYFASETVVDTTMRGLVIAGLFTGVIVVLICFGISRIIKQNILIIKNLEVLNNNSRK